VDDHFVEITEMVGIGSGAQRPVKTVMVSRYACYLVIQNADPAKEIVALGQTYFAVQTRRQELIDQQIEAQRRLLLRAEVKAHNLQLADAAVLRFVGDAVEKAGNVELKWRCRALRLPRQPIIGEYRPFVARPPHLDRARLAVDHPVVRDAVPLKELALGNAVMPRRTR